MPLVGVPAPRFVTKGIWTAVAVAGVVLPGAGGKGGAPFVSAGDVDTPGMNGRNIGLTPTAELPPNILLPLEVANASCVPMSWAKERDADTTRASISTCCDLRSNWRIRLSITGIVDGMSRMMSWLERSSDRISPRELR